MSTIRVVNIQHSDATEPNIVLEADGTTVFASGITISGGTNLTVSGTAEFASGTVSAPSITFIDDNNTGIYSPGADQLAISTSGTAALTVDSSQRVGIGTASPGSLLEVKSSSQNPQLFRLYNSYNSTESSWGVDFYRDTDSGSNSATAEIKAVRTGGNNTDLRFGTSSTPGTVLERARITSDGKLGVGTTSADGMLHIKGSGTHGSLILEAGGTSGTTNLMYLQGHNNAGTAIGEISFDETATDQGGLTFKTNGGTLTTKMTLTSAGNVGIGTTGPSHLCQIAGTLAVDSYNDTTKTITLRPGFEANANGGMGLAAKDHSGAAPDGLGIYGTDGVSVHTANAGTFFERFRVDTSGRLLVGTSSARSDFAHTTAPQLQVEGTNFPSSTISITRNSADNGGSVLQFAKSRASTVGGNGVVANNDVLGYIFFDGNDGADFSRGVAITAEVDGTPGINDMPCRLVFGTAADGAASPTERMRIGNNGIVRIMCDNYAATPGAGNSGVQIANAATASVWAYNNTTAATHIIFANANGNVGTIQTSGSSTSYNTSSDYRLKENIAPVTDGITRLQQLKPSRFNFIADPDTTLDGFLAHEVQTIVPEAITGEKDAVDDEGNPKYQGIDQSKLVPLLTAALQEAIAKIETLEQRLSDAGIA